MARRIALAAALVFAFASGTVMGQAGDGPRGARPGATPDGGSRGGAAAGAQVRSVDLRPRFEQGQVIRFRLTVDSVTDQNLGEAFGTGMGAGEGADRQTPSGGSRAGSKGSAKGDGAIRSSVELGLTLTVRQASAETGAVVDLTIASVKARSDLMGERTEYDSTTPATTAKPGSGGQPGPGPDASDVLARTMRSLVGTTMTMTFDRAGNITSITGGDTLAALGGSITAGGGGAAVPGLPGGKRMFESIFSPGGRATASVGDQWTTQSVIDSGLLGEFRITNRHRLASYSGTRATIATQGQIKSVTENAGSTFRLGDSSMTGSAVWDTREGMLHEMSQTMTVRIDGTLMGEPLQTTSESKMRVVRVR